MAPLLTDRKERRDMPRSTRSDIASLKQEVEALEVLAREADYSPDRVQEYWSISVDLLHLSQDTETLQRTNPQATYEDPELLQLKRRLRDITYRLTDLTRAE